MMADLQGSSIQSGYLTRSLYRKGEFFYELLNFIAAELPRWRERPERLLESAEDQLTKDLVSHLNSASGRSIGWDILQFRREEPDELDRRRRIDFVPATRNATICVDGRGYYDFNALMPIECKRLPTPVKNNRDEREYVFDRYRTSGGIQRFMLGHHGGAHNIGAMIAYIQNESGSYWLKQIGDWINDLSASKENGWTSEDSLDLEKDDLPQRMKILKSSHRRKKNLPKIELHHLWIEMK
jgi:hypothetical protein